MVDDATTLFLSVDKYPLSKIANLMYPPYCKFTNIFIHMLYMWDNNVYFKAAVRSVIIAVKRFLIPAAIMSYRTSKAILVLKPQGFQSVFRLLFL